jgi:hypothetical protein
MAIPDDSEILSTISAKVPRWVEDELLRVCRETGLMLSQAVRIELIELAKITKKNFKRGPALGPFLEHLEFHSRQYDLFFGSKK